MVTRDVDSEIGKVMIVDDNPSNLRLLEEVLSSQGHELRSFPRGRMALAAAVLEPPDLMLLDINMPELNGYEVCQQLKAIPELAGIPVIFLSGLHEEADKVRAFGAGGVDYISKPFQMQEVRARVKTHLQLYKFGRKLRQQNEALEEMVRLRTVELKAALDRLALLDKSKSDFLSLISHELRTPLNGLIGSCEVILADMPMTALTGEMKEMFDLSRNRMVAILDDALLMTQIDAGSFGFASDRVHLGMAVGQAIGVTEGLAASQGVAVTYQAADPSFVRGEEGLLVHALRALLETAIRFTTPGASVRVSHTVEGRFPSLVIETTGHRLPERILAGFFDLFTFSGADLRISDVGLGPAVAYRILAVMGSTLTIQNRAADGIRLVLGWPNETI